MRGNRRKEKEREGRQEKNTKGASALRGKE